MIKYVLDSSAVLRFLDREAGAERVRAIFRACAGGEAEPYISAVQWGEIAAVQRKRSGAREQERVLQRLRQINLRVVAASAERAMRAAELRVDHGIAYADAFALELAMDSPDHLLVTADYDFKATADVARIEFLPVK